MASKLSICNNALLLTGSDEIVTFDEGTRQAKICNALYDTTTELMLSCTTWSFASGQVELARITGTPLFDYTYIYQLPTDPKMLKIVRKNNPANDYRIFEDKMYTDDSSVQIIYVFDPGVANYPSYFVRALEFEMTKLLAMSLIQDDTMVGIMDEMALKELLKAKGIDAQQDPPFAIDQSAFSLISVRG